jgi:hypothetical protein
MTLGERADIKAAIDILKAARSVDKDADILFHGGVSIGHLEEWLDLYASESSDPKEALTIIKRRLPDFEPTRYLYQAIAESEAEKAS